MSWPRTQLYLHRTKSPILACPCKSAVNNRSCGTTRLLIHVSRSRKHVQVHTFPQVLCSEIYTVSNVNQHTINVNHGFIGPVQPGFVTLHPCWIYAPLWQLTFSSINCCLGPLVSPHCNVSHVIDAIHTGLVTHAKYMFHTYGHTQLHQLLPCFIGLITPQRGPRLHRLILCWSCHP